MKHLTFNKLWLLMNVYNSPIWLLNKTWRDEIATHELALHSEFLARFGLDPGVQIQRLYNLSINLQTINLKCSLLCHKMLDSFPSVYLLTGDCSFNIMFKNLGFP